jgi:hypothetical protein
VSEPAADRPPSPGRAFLVYSVLRFALLLASFAVLRLVLPDADGLLVVGGAVLLSALLSVVVLKPQREAFTAASMARAEERRAAKAARRARLEQPGRTVDDEGTTPP